MEIAAAEVSAEGLAGRAAEAARLLTAGHIEQLAQSYGYALAFGRDTSDAIRTDLADCLADLGATGLGRATPAIEVTFFEPGSDLAALAQCTLPAVPAGEVLLELVVTVAGGKHHVALEQISAVA